MNEVELNRQSNSVQREQALRCLFDKIALTAAQAGGAITRAIINRSLEPFMTDTPTEKDVPALSVKMPNGLEITFAPDQPLDAPGNTIRVTAKRSGHEWEWSANYIRGQWRHSEGPLSDEDIKECWKSNGPSPARY